MYTKKGEMYMEQEKIEQLRKEAMENYRIMRECDKTLRKINNKTFYTALYIYNLFDIAEELNVEPNMVKFAYNYYLDNGKINTNEKC